MLGERRINDKVAIVRDDRTGLFHAHAQRQPGFAVRQALGRAELSQVGQYLGIGEGNDFDGDALSPLYHQFPLVGDTRHVSR